MKLTCPFAFIYCFFTFPFPTGNKEAVFCYTVLCQADRQILQGSMFTLSGMKRGIYF
jgi:hypothetical protein